MHLWMLLVLSFLELRGQSSAEGSVLTPQRGPSAGPRLKGFKLKEKLPKSPLLSYQMLLMI